MFRSARHADLPCVIGKAVLGSSALCLAMIPGVAFASCAVTSGSGTVANPGPNTTITCSNATTGLNVNSTADGTTVLLDPNAFVQGNPGDAITINSTTSFVTFAQLGTMKDMTIDLNNPASGGIIMLALNASSGIENTVTANTISVRGANARIIVDDNSQIQTATTLAIEGPNGLFSVSNGGRVVATTSLTGPLIRGGAFDEAFNLDGRLIGLSSGGVIDYIDAGDGDDKVILTANTALSEFSSTTPPVSSIRIRGGNGVDSIELDGGSGNGTLAFSTTDFERLLAYSQATWQLSGSHAFQEIRINPGATIETSDFTSLGLPASSIELDRQNPNIGRLVIRDSGTHQFQHTLFGPGEIEFAAGDYTFQNASPSFNGSVLNNGATLRVEHGQAFGNARIINNADVILRDVTLGNSLFGNGFYIVDGTSSRLTGFGNQMSGFVEIRSGELQVDDLHALGNQNTPLLATLAIGQNTRFVLDLASNGPVDLQGRYQVLGNPLSGSGTFAKRGPGSVIIEGSNPVFIGQTRLEGGFLHIANQDGLGSAANGTNLITFAGGALSLGDIVLNNQLTGQGVIDKSTSGRTVMTGDNQGASLTWTVNAGTLAGTQSRNFGASGTNIALGGNATFELTNATDHNLDLRFAGLSGSTFRKLGAGRLAFVDLFGVSNFAVDAGSIRVNQTITANTTLASGTRLDGTGRIIGNVTNNGTVAPGNSIGTLTVQGNYVHNANSVLEIEFNGSGGIDLLDVTGNATLNGGTLRFISLGGAEGNGGTFLRTGGTLTGTFATVETVGAQLPLAVIYQANSALMAPSVLTARPSTFNAQFLAAAQSALGYMDLLDTAAAFPASGRRLWLQGFGATGNRSASGTTLAYGHDSFGVGGGVNLPISDTSSIGFSIGWSKGDIELAAGGGGGEQRLVLGGLHFAHSGQGFDLAAGAVYGKLKQETLRNVSFNGFSASVSGKTESSLFGGFLRAGAKLAESKRWTLGTHARIAWLRQSQDAYSESGNSPLRLTVPDLKTSTLEAQAGFDATMSYGSEDRRGNLRFELGGRLLSMLGDRAIPVSFAASNAGVTLQGDRRDGMHGYARAQLSHPLGGTAMLHLGYSGQLGTSDRHEGRIGLSFGF